MAYVLSVAASPAVRHPIGDARAYHGKALAILSGDWLGERIFYQDPLYPYVLAGLYAIFGVGGTGVLVAQALLDAATAVLVFAIARRLFGLRCGVVAGVLAALYGPCLFYDAFRLKVALSLFLGTLALWLAVRAEASARGRRWLAAGVALGLAATTRANFLLFAPVLAVWAFLARPRGEAGRAARAAALVAGLLLAILPVTARNAVVGGDFVLVTSQAGQNFYIGNFRGNRSGVYKPPPFVVANARHEEDDFRAEAIRRAGHEMRPSEISGFWLREGLREIAADPAHFARHTARKVALLASAYEVPDNYSLAYFREHVASLLRAPLASWGLVLPLALCGMVFARHRRPAVLLVAFAATYAASLVLFYHLSRYRLPLAPVAIVFAAAAVTELAARVARRAWRDVAPAAAFLAVAWPLVHVPLVAPEDFGLFRSNLATVVDEEAEALWDAGGDRARARELWETAEAEFRKGLEAAPHDPRLRLGLRRHLVARVGRLLAAGASGEALERARSLTHAFPGYAEGFALLGESHARLGQREPAAASLRRALELQPGNPRARAELQRLREGE